MSLITFRTVSFTAAIAAILLSAGNASAEEELDGARFRGGVQGEAGTLVIPGSFTVGYAGVSGQLGAQINNLVGVYAIPQLDVVFGRVGGVHIGAAVVADFTFGDIVSVGAGPEVAAFAAIGVDNDGNGARATGGALYGARIHGAVYPLVGKGDNGYSRKAFAIGLDLRLLGGGAGSAEVNDQGETVSVTNFVFAPQLTIGYQAF